MVVVKLGDVGDVVVVSRGVSFFYKHKGVAETWYGGVASTKPAPTVSGTKGKSVTGRQGPHVSCGGSEERQRNVIIAGYYWNLFLEAEEPVTSESPDSLAG